MNIGIDARPLVEKKTGFGFFLENMLNAILKIDRNDTFYLFSDREIVSAVLEYKNIRAVYYKDNFLCPKSFYYYYKLPGFIKKHGIVLDVFWGTMHLMPRGFDRKVKKILTIHDFTHIKFPEATTKFNLLISKLFFESSIKNADKIICISKNTETELHRYYAAVCTHKPIETIYEGGYSDSGFCEYTKLNVREDIAKLVHDRFVIFVGTIEPRKNISLLIESAPLLKGKTKIVICGKIGWENKSVIEKLYSTDNLIYFDYVNQDEKIFLMKHSFCQVQPSLYEGFGLPVVESMQAGTVVLVADNSSLSELVEMSELKFETTNVDDFCKKLSHLLENQHLYNEAESYCINRGKKFSWEKAAIEYLKAFS